MPTFDVELPDGQVVQFDGDSAPTPEAVRRVMAQVMPRYGNASNGNSVSKIALGEEDETSIRDFLKSAADGDELETKGFGKIIKSGDAFVVPALEEEKRLGPPPTPVESFVRSALGQVGPTAAGVGTSAAVLRAPIPNPYVKGGLALIAGGLTAYGASRLEDAALDKFAPSVSEKRRRDFKTNPRASLLGTVLPNLLFFKPGSSGGGLVREATNRGVSGAIGGASQTAQEVINAPEGKAMGEGALGRIALATGADTLLANPNKLGNALFGNAVQKAATKAEPSLVSKIDNSMNAGSAEATSANANKVAMGQDVEAPAGRMPEPAPSQIAETPVRPREEVVREQPVRVSIDDDSAIEAAALAQAAAKKKPPQDIEFLYEENGNRYFQMKDPSSKRGSRTVDIAKLEEEGFDTSELTKPIQTTPEEAPFPVSDERPIRNLAKRIIEDKAQPEQLRETLSQNPEVRYDEVAVGDIIKKASKATDDELSAMSLSDNDIVKSVGVIERANRLDAAGQLDEAAKLYAEAASSFTSSAQLLNAAKAVRSPRAYVEMTQRVIDNTVGKKRDGSSKLVMTAKQKNDIENLGRAEIKAQRELDAIESAAMDDFTPANEKAYKDAKRALGAAKLNTAEYIRRLAPQSWSDIFSKAIQGNLLTPLSIASSLGGNTLFHPIRRGIGSLSSVFDEVFSRTAKAISPNTKIRRTISDKNPLPSIRELKAGAEGIKIAAKEMLTGPSADSYVKGEVQRGFKPLRSLIQAFSGEGYAVNSKGNIPLSSRAKSVAEAIIGAAPETMFRLLNVTDKPFRNAEYMRALLEQARLKGIKGRELERFLTFPDPRSESIAMRESRSSVFAQENKGFDRLNKLLDPGIAQMIGVDSIPAARGAIKVLTRMVAPFRQFPVNYVLTALDFAAPELAFGKAIYYSSKGDQRMAMKSLATGVMGATLYAATDFLWDNGLISEPVSNDFKKRSIQQNTMGAQRINVSGLERALDGGDPSWRTGDKTVDWGRSGIPAAIFYIRTRQLAMESEKRAKAGVVPEIDGSSRDIISTTASGLANRVSAFPGMASFALDQSFLAGTSTWLEMMKNPDPDSSEFQNGIQNMFRVISAIPVPNTVDAVARAEYEFIPELKGDNIWQTMGNIWKYKTFQLPEDDRTAVKRGFWGEKLKRTPEGANPYVYGMIDISKFGATKPSEFNDRLYRTYKETESPDVYPSMAGRDITVDGVTVKLSPKDAERLQELEGNRRLELAQEFVLSDEFESIQPWARVYALKSIYSDANRSARDEFLSDPDILERYFGELMGGPSSERVKRRSVEANLRSSEQFGP